MAFNYTKKNFTYTYKDFYKLYKDKKKEEGLKVKQIISQKKYLKAIEYFMILLCRKIGREGFLFILPYNLGNIYLKSTRRTPDNAPIDWNKTKKYGKVIKMLGTNTFGYFYFTHWGKSHVQFKNKTIYRFRIVKSKSATEKNTGKSMIHKNIMEVSKDPKRRSLLKY